MTVRPHGTVILMGDLGGDLQLSYRHLMRNCITIRGQWMYPRDAPVRLLGLIRAGPLSLEHFHVDTFSLSEVNAAIEHAAATAGPFRMTIIRPC
jgi:alcohol dehydrogenase